MTGTQVDGRLLRIADVVDAGAAPPPAPGRLAAQVLHALMSLVPCDCVTYAELEPGAATHHADDELEDGQVRYLESPAVEPDEPFWRHYASAPFCSYPTRTGDDRSVILRSDFCSTREWRATGMWADVARPHGVTYELMCPLPSPPGRSRRVLFFRSGSQDFDEQDRFALALLRPHLSEMLGRRSTAPSVLTERQAELIGLVADGRTNAEIAAELHLSPHTVRTHLTNIFERLGVTTRAAAVARVFSA